MTESFGEQACILLETWPKHWANCIERGEKRKWWKRLLPRFHVFMHKDIGLFRIYWYGRVQHCGLSTSMIQRNGDIERELIHVRTMTWREQLRFQRAYRAWRRQPFDLNKLPLNPGEHIWGP